MCGHTSQRFFIFHKWSKTQENGSKMKSWECPQIRPDWLHFLAPKVAFFSQFSRVKICIAFEVKKMLRPMTMHFHYLIFITYYLDYSWCESKNMLQAEKSKEP